MESNKNNIEVELLRTDIGELLKRYQFIIQAVVSRFANRGFFQHQDKKEIVQKINLQLLDGKMDRIKKNYNGSVLLSTYFSKVVYNSCLEIIRTEKRKPSFVSDEVLDYQSTGKLDSSKELLIKDEMKRLQAILTSFERRKEKLLLCLKLYAKKLLNEKDIEEFNAPATRELCKEVLSNFSKPYHQLDDKMVYQKVIALFNKLENKNSDPDSLRKWLNMQLDKMIQLLNGNPPSSAYDRNSLRLLLNLFYSEKYEEDFPVD